MLRFCFHVRPFLLSWEKGAHECPSEDNRAPCQQRAKPPCPPISISMWIRRQRHALGAPPDTDQLSGHGQRLRGRAAMTWQAGGWITAAPGRLRRFSTWEITRYLIPVAQGHFRRVLKQNPDLPQGCSETEGGAKWFTFDEVLRLKAHFGQGRLQDEGIPALPAQSWPARQGPCCGELQGRGRQDLDSGASGHVCRA